MRLVKTSLVWFQLALSLPVGMSLMTSTAMGQNQVRKDGRAQSVAQKNTTDSVDYRGEAKQELAVSAKQQSSEVLSTPATVRSKIPVAVSPISERDMHLGLALSHFEPKGYGRVPGLAPYDLNSAGNLLMPSLEFRWHPLSLENTDRFLWGGFSSFGYTTQRLQLVSPSQQSVPRARLHVFKAAVGFASSYKLSKLGPWSLGSSLGVGYLTQAQTGLAELANTSSGMAFMPITAALQWRQESSPWLAFLGYEYRQPLASEREDIGLTRHQAIIGILGSLR